MRFQSMHILRGLLLLAVTSIAFAPAIVFAQQKVKVTRADIGFGGRYQVGSWTPLQLEVTGGEKTFTAVASVRVPDGEGTSTEITSLPFSLPAGGIAKVELLVRVGQLDAPAEVQISNLETGKRVSKRTFVTRRELDKGGIAPGEPATTRMVVEIGSTHLGTSTVGAQKSSDQFFTQNIVGRIADLATLPRNALAYESIDTVIASTSDRDAWSGLRADDPRMAALRDWVQHGGRMVLFCGSNADIVIGSNGPLAELAPGNYADMVTVDDLKPLENYVGDNEPLPSRGRLRTAIPRFDNLHGDVELTLGGRENALPVVIRSRVGLGQVVFVALDIDTPPLQNWKNRNQIVAKMLAFADDDTPTESDNYYYDGPADIVLTLSQRLDQELEKSGIRTPPFLAIAGLVMLYILLIGPGDYWLVKHVLKRMEWTWVTFPAIVLATCLAAYWYANYLKGDSLRINQLEIVDIDNTTGQTRGTLWTHIFSPSPDRYSLALDAKTPTGDPADVETSSVAWLGRPASGMGGMSTDAGMLLGRPVYGWSSDRQMLAGAPIEVWSTKTFVSRWQTHSGNVLESNLNRTNNNLVEGTVANPTTLSLTNCKLVYGTWAWRLGDLAAGDSATVEHSGLGNTASAPKKLRNLFKSEFNFDLSQGSYYEKQQLVQRTKLQGIAEMMMFYDALGGRTQSHQWHRYQQFVDLSHAMDSDTAMLIGECHSPRSELSRLKNPNDPSSAESMRGDKDVNVVLYRFLLPVQPVADPSNET